MDSWNLSKSKSRMDARFPTIRNGTFVPRTTRHCRGDNEGDTMTVLYTGSLNAVNSVSSDPGGHSHVNSVVPLAV